MRGKSRIFLPFEAKKVLEKFFKANLQCPYPTLQASSALERQTGLTRKQIQNWYASVGHFGRHGSWRLSMCTNILLCSLRFHRARKRRYDKFHLPTAAKEVLAKFYEDNLQSPYPNKKEMIALENQTGLKQTQIKDWYVFFEHFRRHDSWHSIVCEPFFVIPYAGFIAHEKIVDGISCSKNEGLRIDMHLDGVAPARCPLKLWTLWNNHTSTNLRNGGRFAALYRRLSLRTHCHPLLPLLVPLASFFDQ